jgi:ribosomal protein S18 acetylase RimI-like enzyme
VLGPAEADLLDRVAPDVFDHAIDPAAARAFLADPRFHLAVAIEDGLVVAFASGLHYHHPDKPVPELWIDEVGVAEPYRGRGLGRAVLRALIDRAGALGCSVAWVLTERNNDAAMRLYAAVGGIESRPDPVLFTFPVERPG